MFLFFCWLPYTTAICDDHVRGNLTNIQVVFIVGIVIILGNIFIFGVVFIFEVVFDI